MFSKTKASDSFADNPITIAIAKGGAIKADLKDLVQKGLSKCPESIRYLRQARLITKMQ